MTRFEDPHHVMWQPGADPDLPGGWAITRRQPIASLLVSGRCAMFTRSVPPPAVLHQRRLTITAGSGHVTLNSLPPVTRAAIGELTGHEFEDWRKGLSELPSGCLVGTARLIAWYRLSRLHEGRAYADMSDKAARRAGGVWREFDGVPVLPAGDWRPASEQGERWVWCFDGCESFACAAAPQAGSRPSGDEPCSGLGFPSALARGEAGSAPSAHEPGGFPSALPREEAGSAPSAHEPGSGLMLPVRGFSGLWALRRGLALRARQAALADEQAARLAAQEAAFEDEDFRARARR